MAARWWDTGKLWQTKPRRKPGPTTHSLTPPHTHREGRSNRAALFRRPKAQMISFVKDEDLPMIRSRHQR
jgi:hypothetical protein